MFWVQYEGKETKQKYIVQETNYDMNDKKKGDREYLKR
jgi:hypothetical protein